MKSLIEHFIIHAWNRKVTPRIHVQAGGLDLGCLVSDGKVLNTRVSIPQGKRPEHIAILGKTGQGKSFLLRHLAVQDIQAKRGFVFFDLHGDATPFLLGVLANEERRTGEDLSSQVVVIEPADREYSVGLNVLERSPGEESFSQIAEFTELLKRHWHLEFFGARTEELLRNSLFALSDNHLTLIELPALVTNAAFRAQCMRNVSNPEVRAYFEGRFNVVSDAMQSVFREAILNKVSGFTSDPRFRHILGQQRSTFSLLEAMDRGWFVILNLDKGRLGEQAVTLGSLLLAKLKNALFSRTQRRLFSFYCDEIQNLIAFDSGIDTLLSEARKFGIGIVSANQFLDQYPPHMRSAIFAIGTHIFFQLSSPDADKVSGALDGGKKLAEVLKNLPKRHMIIKSGSDHFRQAAVPDVMLPQNGYADLYRRIRQRYATSRLEVERDIQSRVPRVATTGERLNDWE